MREVVQKLEDHHHQKQEVAVAEEKQEVASAFLRRSPHACILLKVSHAMFNRLSRAAASAAVAAARSSRAFASAAQPIRRLTLAAAAITVGTSASCNHCFSLFILPK
jgi:hypothetical protein